MTIIKGIVWGVAEFIGYTDGRANLLIDDSEIDVTNINGTYVIGVVNSTYYNTDINIVGSSIKLTDIVASKYVYGVAYSAEPSKYVSINLDTTTV